MHNLSASDFVQPSPMVIEKVRHLLRDGFNTRAFGHIQPPEALGDPRWTEELILSTWSMAETGDLPEKIEYCKGRSGGGFDCLDFELNEISISEADLEQIDTSLLLNRRGEGGANLKPPIPWYGGGMSFGSVSEVLMRSRMANSLKWGTYTSTGEGGFPSSLFDYQDAIITQVATGLFGVEEKTLQAVPIIEFKYAQGAKPGLGGHLLSAKTTEEVAEMRGAVPFVSLFSPFPFHSVYSVEDHMKHIDWVKTINPNALISVKVSTPHDVDMVAVGSYYAGAHIIHLDGSYGGTGAAPEIAKKNIAMPIELAIPKVHSYLVSEGIRDQVTLIASGGIRTADDMAKAIALGADGCVLGTTELVALGCTRCSNCERGRGCTYGLTTTDPELSEWIDQQWAMQRLDNLYTALQRRIRLILAGLNLDSVAELRGRTDLLRYNEGRG